MKKLRFIFYYIKLRLTVIFGIHQTFNPLGLKWRWKHWQHRERLHDEF